MMLQFPGPEAVRQEPSQPAAGRSQSLQVKVAVAWRNAITDVKYQSGDFYFCSGRQILKWAPKENEVKIVIGDAEAYVKSMAVKILLWAASAGGDNVVRIWDLLRQQKTGSIEVDYHATKVASDNKRDWLAVVGDSRSVTVWDCKSLQKVTEIEALGADVRDVAFNPEAELLALGHDNGLIAVYSSRTWGVERVLPSRERPVTSVAWHTKKRWLAWGSHGIHLEDLESSQGKSPPFNQGAATKVGSVAFPPIGVDQIAGGYDDGVVRLWDLKTDRQLPLVGPRHPISCMAYDTVGSSLVAGDAGGGLHQWEIPGLWHCLQTSPNQQH